ncbi:MFS transporter [Pseudonocardia sp. CA-107938]|uniref:MFS transporter n=1 Tax=Pseudonocardia sp. CA-107938 TaxID=3240021 RepID=UPI003D8C4C51
MTITKIPDLAERTRGRRVLAVAAVASFMTALDTLAVATALTSIQRDLGARPDQLEWTVNTFNLVMAVCLLPAAALGDRFGRRRIYAAGLALFTAASAVCATAADAGMLIIGRAGQGAGAAVVVALGLALVGTAFPPERRGTAIGMMEAGAGVAILAGPVVGGLITQLVGWEAIFWLNVPVGLVLLPLLLMAVPESTGRPTPVDVVGLTLVAGAVLAAMWGLSTGNLAGWTSPQVAAALVAAGLLAIAFLAWERRAAHPLLPPHLLRNRGFIAGIAAVAALFVQVFGGLFFFGQLFQVGLGFDPAAAGLALVPWTGMMIVVGPLGGRLADRVGPRLPILGGLSMIVVGMVWVALVTGSGTSYVELVVPLVVISIGGSLAIPPATTAVIGAVSADEVGIASGVTSMVRELAGTLGLAVMVAVFTGSGGGYGSAAQFVTGFGPAMWTAVALIVAGTLAATLLPRRRAS